MRCRVVAVVLGAALLATTAAGPAAAGAPAPPAVTDADVDALRAEGAGLRATRSELLARIAVLSDRAEAAHARLVAAQDRSVRVTAAVTGARRAFVEHAVQAFVHAGALPEEARARGSIYAEVVGDVDRAVADALATAEAAAAAEHQAATTSLDEARHTAIEVAAARAQLEATIAVHEEVTEAAEAEAARNAVARRLAEEQARAREVAAWTAAEHAARREEAGRVAAATARASTADGGVARSGRLAGAHTPRQVDRISRATAAEAALMAAHPFGPVPGLPPGATLAGTVVEGLASWYGPGFDGRPTASGALYDQEGWTVASKELPLGTVLLVTRGDRSVLVLVNDRGPFVAGRVLDLSHAVARELGTVGPGVANVRASVVLLP